VCGCCFFSFVFFSLTRATRLGGNGLGIYKIIIIIISYSSHLMVSFMNHYTPIQLSSL